MEIGFIWGSILYGRIFIWNKFIYKKMAAGHFSKSTVLFKITPVKLFLFI